MNAPRPKDCSIIVFKDGQECPSYFPVGQTFLSDPYRFYYYPDASIGEFFQLK